MICIFAVTYGPPSIHAGLNYGTLLDVLDGSSVMGAHIRNNLCYLICYLAFDKIKSNHNRIFSILLHACVTCSGLPFNICTMGL